MPSPPSTSAQKPHPLHSKKHPKHPQVDIHQIIKHDYFFKNYDIIERALKTIKPVKHQCKTKCDTHLIKAKSKQIKQYVPKDRSELHQKNFIAPANKNDLIDQLDNIFEEYDENDIKCKEKHQLYKEKNDQFQMSYAKLQKAEIHRNPTSQFNQLIKDYKEKNYMLSPKIVHKNIFTASPLLMTSKSDIDVHYKIHPPIKESIVENSNDNGASEPVKCLSTRNKPEKYLKHLSDYVFNITTAMEQNQPIENRPYIANMNRLHLEDKRMKKHQMKMEIKNEIKKSMENIKGLDDTISNLIERPEFYDNENDYHNQMKRTKSSHFIKSNININSNSRFDRSNRNMNLTSTAGTHTIKSKTSMNQNNNPGSTWMTMLSLGKDMNDSPEKSKIKFGSFRNEKKPPSKRLSMCPESVIDIDNLSPLSDKNQPMNYTMAMNLANLPIKKTMTKSGSFYKPSVCTHRLLPNYPKIEINDMYSTVKNLSVFQKDKQNMSKDISEYFHERNRPVDIDKKKFKSSQLFDLISYTKNKVQSSNIRRVLYESYRHRISDQVKENMEALNNVEGKINLFDFNLVKCILKDEVKE